MNLRLLFVSYLTIFVLMLGAGLVGPILSPYARAFGVSYAAAGLVISAFGIARVFIDLPAGFLADKIGRRKLLVAGPLIVTLAALGLAITPIEQKYYPLAIFLRLVQGTGSSLFIITATIYIADLAPKGRLGRVLSFYEVSIHLGMVCGPVLGGIVAESYGLNAPFYFYAVGAFASSTVSLVLIKERIKSPLIASLKFQSIFKSLKELLFNKNLFVINLLSFANFFTRSGIRSTMIPLFAKEFMDLPFSKIGIVLSVATLINLFLLPISGILSDKFGRKIVFIPGFLLYALAIFLIPFCHSFMNLIGVAVLIGIGTGLSDPIPITMAADFGPSEVRGTIMGLYRVFGDIGYVAGPILLGAIADSIGMSFSFYVTSMLLVIDVALIVLLVKKS